MMRLFFFLALLLVCSFPVQGKQPESCPPPCKGSNLYVFSDKFCCTKDQTFDLHCVSYRQEDTCRQNQSVLVSFGPPAPEHYEANKKNSNVSFHQCQNKKRTLIAWEYLSEFSVFAVDLYQSDFYSFFWLDAFLDYDLDVNDELVQRALKNMLTYFCVYYDPEPFFEKQQITPFSFPHLRKSNTRTKTSAKKINNRSAVVIPPAKKPTTPTTPPVSQANSQVAKQSKDPNATYMLDTNFYRQPTPGNLSSVREFATADKQQVLKINFTSDDKDPFLQKLQKQFAQEPYKITSCKNNTKLFEVQTNPYQVFILSSNAVSVLIKPTGYPATAALRKQLCNFNAALAW